MSGLIKRDDQLNEVIQDLSWYDT